MADHDALCRQQHWEGGDCFDCRLIAKVRADERGRMQHVDFYAASVARRVVLADLRAKVEALASPDPEYNNAICDVLALIDGSSDG